MGTRAVDVVGDGVKSAVGTLTRYGLGSAVGTLAMKDGGKVRCGDSNGKGGSGPLWGRVMQNEVRCGDAYII